MDNTDARGRSLLDRRRLKGGVVLLVFEEKLGGGWCAGMVWSRQEERSRMRSDRTALDLACCPEDLGFYSEMWRHWGVLSGGVT